MKIIYIQQHFYLPSSQGGSRPFEHASRLAAAGHEVHVISQGGEAKTEKRWSYQKVAGFHLHQYPTAYKQSMSNQKRILAFIKFALVSTRRARAIKGDLVFASSTPLTVAVPGILASVFPRRPFIFEVRDLWPDLPIAFGALKSPIAKSIARSLEYWAYRHARHIVALSPDMKASIKRQVKNGKAITTIPNAADVDRFTLPQMVDEWRIKSNRLPSGRPLLTYAGTFGQANRVDFFIQVARHLNKIGSNAVVLLIGNGKEKPKIMEQARASGCYNNNLFIMDPVPKNMMPIIYASSKIILSSLAPMKELEASSPNKVFDAFAAGRPVAINYGGWLANVILNSGAGIVTEFNAQTFAHEVDEILNDESRLLEAEAASAALGRHDFNRDRLASQLIEILEREYAEFKHRSQLRLS